MSHCMHWTESRHDPNFGVCHYPLWSEVRDSLPLWFADAMQSINKEAYCSNCPARRTLEQHNNDTSQTTNGTQLLQVLYSEPARSEMVGCTGVL